MYTRNLNIRDDSFKKLFKKQNYVKKNDYIEDT